MNKKDKLLDLCEELEVSLDNVAYIGDGIIDIPVFEIAGCSISVPNGHDAVKKRSLLITEKSGGEVLGFIFAINLFDLGGKKLLENKGYKTYSLMDFPGH